MPKVTYIRPEGTRVDHEVDAGTTVMQAAIMQGEDGIVAECGGQLMCATCHVYVDDNFVDHFPQPNDEEEELLSCTAAERRSSSRLSCQLVVTNEEDGLTVVLPELQL